MITHHIESCWLKTDRISISVEILWCTGRTVMMKFQESLRVSALLYTAVEQAVLGSFALFLR